MKIDIDKYLRKHRDKLDVEQPEDNRVWEGIRNDLYTKKRILSKQFLRIASIALILLSVGYISQIINKKNQPAKANLYSISKLLGEHEQYYLEKVNTYLYEIEKTPIGDDLIITELLEELKSLDTIYNEAFSELQQFGYKEETVNILFDTYEKKIRILELIINESLKTKEYENKESKILL